MDTENTNSNVTRLSFFDTNQNLPTLWKQRDLADFATYPCIIESKFYLKTNKTFLKWDTCQLSIKGNFLIFSKGKKKTQNDISYIDLDEYMHQLKTSAPNGSTKYKHCFTISSHGNSATFYSKDQAQFNQFLLHMRKFCVMTEFTDNYQVLDVLGSGGYGQVYLVQDKTTKLKYAGKVIHISPLKCLEKQRLMIMNEIKILKKLNHQNIIKLYEVYEKNNQICLITEYVPGKRLFEYIVQSGKLSETETAILMKQLFLTLTYLETQGILHRDIKPENILVVKSAKNIELKLIDFGLATNWMKLDIIKKCGTAGYTAPEVFTGDSYDFKADLYSSGIVMHICLTGRPVYYGNEYKELYDENKKAIVRYKDRHWQDISREAKDLVQRILVANPSQRLSVDQVLSHKWFGCSLTADEMKEISDFNFKTKKMLIAEEEGIANIPMSPQQVLPSFSLNSRLSLVGVGSTSLSFVTSKIAHGTNSGKIVHSFYKNRTKDELETPSMNTLNSQAIRHSGFFKNAPTLSHRNSIFANNKERSEPKDLNRSSYSALPTRTQTQKSNLAGTRTKLQTLVKENSGDSEEQNEDFILTDAEESPIIRKYERLQDMDLCFHKISGGRPL